MIKLDLFKFCEGCPDFEADVNKTTLECYYEKQDTNTIIMCKNRERCRKIAEYIAKRNGIKIE